MDQIKKAGATQTLKHAGLQMLEHFPALSLLDRGKKRQHRRKMKLGLLDPPNRALVPRIKD